MSKLIEKAGDYDPVPCPLPGCGQALHLRLHSDQYLYASFDAEALHGMVSGDLNHWEVTCEAGHVILVPPDDGVDVHLFGVCGCDAEADGGHDEGCADGDFERLRRLVNGIAVT